MNVLKEAEATPDSPKLDRLLEQAELILS